MVELGAIIAAPHYLQVYTSRYCNLFYFINGDNSDKEGKKNFSSL